MKNIIKTNIILVTLLLSIFSQYQAQNTTASGAFAKPSGIMRSGSKPVGPSNIPPM